MRRFLRTLILLLIRLIGLPGAFAAAKQTTQPLPLPPCILLIRPDHLGDIVLTTPILHALKTYAPNAQLTMMVGPWSSEIVARHPDIDRLITCPFPGFSRAPQGPLAPYILLFNVAQQLRRSNYDLAINLRPDFWWGAALLYLARIPRRIGYALKPGRSFLTHALPFQAPEHATISNLRLASAGLKALGYPPLAEPFTPEQYPLQFTPTSQEQQEVTERLKKVGINPDDPFVVIHAGSGAAVKLWRTDAWVACANTLPALLKASPIRIILTGSNFELPMLEEIAQGIVPRPVLVSDASVGQLAALLGRALLVLGVDNGPLHLAIAQETPTIQLFGPTDFRIFGPWGRSDRHIVIASTQRCPSCPTIPCERLDFSPEELPAHPCVRLIKEQEVLAASNSLFSKPSTVEIHDTNKTTTEHTR